MYCNSLKINMSLSFVMRRSPVRVREVAQKGQKARKCLKMSKSNYFGLLIFAYICTKFIGFEMMLMVQNRYILVLFNA